MKAKELCGYNFCFLLRAVLCVTGERLTFPRDPVKIGWPLLWSVNFLCCRTFHLTNFRGFFRTIMPSFLRRPWEWSIFNTSLCVVYCNCARNAVLSMRLLFLLFRQNPSRITFDEVAPIYPFTYRPRGYVADLLDSSSSKRDRFGRQGLPPLAFIWSWKHSGYVLC